MASIEEYNKMAADYKANPTSGGAMRLNRYARKLKAQNQAEFGGTGEAFTFGDKTYQPGDEGYLEAINAAQSAIQQGGAKAAPLPPTRPRLDNFGLPTNLPRTPGELRDIQDASIEVSKHQSQWAADGFSPGEIDEFSKSFVKNKVVDGLKSRVAEATSPLTPAQPGATLESESPHIVSVGDVVLEEKYQEKIPLMKPDDTVASATKAMQTNIDNVTKKINKVMESFGKYADMASIGAGSKNIDKMIETAASVNAKYMKVMFNKMMEYTNKKVNKELSAVIASMPASKRSQFADMKNLMNQNSLQQFGGIADGIGGMLTGILRQSFNVDSLIQQATQKALNPITPRSSSVGVKDWIPSMIVQAGEKIRFRNNVYKVEKSGRTGTTLPIESSGTQSNGNTSLILDSFVEGDGTDVSYGDVRTYPKVPMCYAENVIGQAIGANKGAIEEANGNIINGINAFIGDMQAELDEAEKEIRPKARDGAQDGKVLGFTDEEGLGNNQGGSYYITQENVGCSGSGNVRPIGVSSTTAGPGSQLTVDITVSHGGATGTSEGELYIKLTDGGSGYNTGGGVPSNTGTNNNESTTGGTGSGCLANITYDGGIVSKVTITQGSGGSDYIAGDELTVTGSNGGSGCKFEIIKPRGRIDSMIGVKPGIIINNPGRGYMIGELITIGRETYNGVAADAKFTITSTDDPGDFIKNEQTPQPGAPGGPQKLGSMLSSLSGITGSLTSALNFKNMVSNLFPFETPPVPAMSDFYTFARGAAAVADSQLPSMKAIGDAANVIKTPPSIPDPVEFVRPTTDTPDVIQDSDLDDAMNASPEELDEAFNMF